jgi:hypothetical protein
VVAQLGDQHAADAIEIEWGAGVQGGWVCENGSAISG